MTCECRPDCWCALPSLECSGISIGSGLEATIPHSAAGWRIEPPVSVPIAQGASPAATAAALPPLDLEHGHDPTVSASSAAGSEAGSPSGTRTVTRRAEGPQRSRPYGKSAATEGGGGHWRSGPEVHARIAWADTVTPGGKAGTTSASAETTARRRGAGVSRALAETPARRPLSEPFVTRSHWPAS